MVKATAAHTTSRSILGQASIYYGAAWGSSIPIIAYTTTQLGNLFNNLNDLSWSVGGCVDADGDGGSAAKPDGTLWLTDPRANPGTPSAAWVCEDIYSQALGCQGIETIMDDDQVDSQLYHSTALVDTSTALSITANTTWAPDSALGALGNYNGGFSGVVENTTPHTFATAGSPSRSDFYELQPSASRIGGPGTYLGTSNRNKRIVDILCTVHAAHSEHHLGWRECLPFVRLNPGRNLFAPLHHYGRADNACFVLVNGQPDHHWQRKRPNLPANHRRHKRHLLCQRGTLRP